jgi:hypothetical protein
MAALNLHHDPSVRLRAQKQTNKSQHLAGSAETARGIAAAGKSTTGAAERAAIGAPYIEGLFEKEMPHVPRIRR